MDTSTATTEVEIRFKCTDLIRADLFSKSDPFIVLYSTVNGSFTEIGRTETVPNCHNATFNKAFILDYYFEEIQELCVEIYDRDSPSEDLKAHDFLGQVQFTLGRLIGSRGQSMVMDLQPRSQKSNRKLGQIEIKAEEVATCADVFDFQFSARNLDKKNGFFGKSDPFLNIYRAREDGQWLRVWSSEVIKNELNPIWQETKIECMDWEKNGKHQLIGVAETSIQQWVESSVRDFPLINQERKAKKGSKYKNSGVIKLAKLQIRHVPTFTEYLRNGLEINLIVGIDYTASNGAPSDPGSLHFIQGQYMNQYQMAIHATGTILQEYDSDRKFPVYGFGGKINGQVNHCFPVTMDPSHVEVSGVEGIQEVYFNKYVSYTAQSHEQVYRNSFQFVSLHGPTLFAPLINTAGQMAASFAAHSANQYVILLILTDGVIMDMQQTIDAIVNASRLPLSIIIIGVGNANFSAMDELDADDHPLQSSTGQYASRDIVQFVPFSRFQQNIARLTKETLAEIPSQLESYMSTRAQYQPPPMATTGSNYPPPVPTAPNI